MFNEFLLIFNNNYNKNVNENVKKMSRTLKKHFLNTFCHQKWGGGACGCGRLGRETHFWSQTCSKNAFSMSRTYLWFYFDMFILIILILSIINQVLWKSQDMYSHGVTFFQNFVSRKNDLFNHLNLSTRAGIPMIMGQN